MTVGDLIDHLKNYPSSDKVCILDYSSSEYMYIEIQEVYGSYEDDDDDKPVVVLTINEDY